MQLEQKFSKDRRQHNEAVLWKFAEIPVLISCKLKLFKFPFRNILFPQEKKKGHRQETDSQLSKSFNKGYWAALLKGSNDLLSSKRKICGIN